AGRSTRIGWSNKRVKSSAVRRPRAGAVSVVADACSSVRACPRLVAAHALRPAVCLCFRHLRACICNALPWREGPRHLLVGRRWPRLPEQAPRLVLQASASQQGLRSTSWLDGAERLRRGAVWASGPCLRLGGHMLID